LYEKYKWLLFFWDIRHLRLGPQGLTFASGSADLGIRREEEVLESAAVPGDRPAIATAPIPSTGEKGLKKNAIGFVSSVVIGVASTAPGYSLAATLGFVAAAVGTGSPAILLVSFIPMFLVAGAYYYMNRADPDCGTSFSWVTLGMGPHLGWMVGWVIIVTDIVVMANLAQIAGLYTFLLFGWNSAAASTVAVTAVGVVWIAIMTAIVVIGIELSARTQVGLLAAEIVTLALFSVVALIKVYAGSAAAGAVHPSLSWINPFALSPSEISAGMLLAVFIYWGWDTTATVNEETEDPTEAPGKATVISTLILLGIYVVVAYAAQAYGGVANLVEHQEDVLSTLGTEVFGSPLDKLLIIAVLTSAAASTQTTILPAARTTLSMARAKALPGSLGDVHPRFLTPARSTIYMGVLSIVWYVGLTIVSEDILFDSLAALGLMIAFYIGITGFACAIYYRRELLRSVKNFLFVGVGPTLGGVILFYLLVKNAIELSDPANSESGNSWFGIGPPLLIAAAFMVLGVVLMVVQWSKVPAFFRRKPDVVAAGFLEGEAPSHEPPSPTGAV
jgi:amino acid transporter